MDQIIPMIFDEIGTDGENESEELVEYYNVQAVSSGRP